MELEAKQCELLEQFCLLAKSVRGRGAVEIIKQATSEPGLFAFGELVDTPSVQELEGTEHASWLNVLRIFAYGTWSDYTSAEGLPALAPQQVLKLKQLTVMAHAGSTKVLPYDMLMRELGITNVRELEDLLINDCMYTGIVQGKLDQQKRCVEVEAAAGRDVPPGQLKHIMDCLGDWLATSEHLLRAIQEKIQWADKVSEAHKKHKADLEAKIEESKKAIKAEAELKGQQSFFGEDGGPASMDYVEEDRVRPKRRR